MEKDDQQQIKEIYPFAVPPPQPTLIEKYQKESYDSMVKLNDGWLKMKDLAIDALNDQINQLNKQTVDKSTEIANLKMHIKTNHGPLVKRIGDLEKELKEAKEKNELLKNELYKCKFKEKHIEGSQDKIKRKDYDKKCVALEISNLHLMDEIEKLKMSNEEKVKSIRKLEAEIESLEQEFEVMSESDDAEERPPAPDTLISYGCDFFELKFNSKASLKRHIVEEHEVNILSQINSQKSNLFSSLQRLQKKEIKLQHVHRFTFKERKQSNKVIFP